MLTWHPAGVVHATCMRGGGGNLLRRGVVRGHLASGTFFESTRACFCEFGQIYLLIITIFFFEVCMPIVTEDNRHAYLSSLPLCLSIIYGKYMDNETNWKYIPVVKKSDNLPSSEQAPIKLTTLGWFPIESIVLSSLYKSTNRLSVPCSRNSK